MRILRGPRLQWLPAHLLGGSCSGAGLPGCQYPAQPCARADSSAAAVQQTLSTRYTSHSSGETRPGFTPHAWHLIYVCRMALTGQVRYTGCQKAHKQGLNTKAYDECSAGSQDCGLTSTEQKG